MKVTSKRKKWKILLFVLTVLASLVFAFHIWFVQHAESLIEDMVRRQSNGKVDLRVRNFKFNWFSKNMELEHAVFFTTDSTAPASYLFAVRQIKIQVQSVWPLVLEKKFLIDSLQLIDPDISVTRRVDKSDTVSASDSSLSIPQEMGRIYHSIQDALQALAVTRFQIINGSFSLFNPARPQDVPVRISRLNLRLDNLRIDSTRPLNQQKIFFSDHVAVETHHQDILFPDGRHRLSFRDFRINTQNRLAEFDSCTIEATRGDSSENSFRIYFDKLRMTNIDFDTLYHAEVIRADSVYAYDPQFKLNVDIPANSPVAAPRLDELLQQLTGELDVAFVVVENGSFDINTMRAGRPSSFTSTDNNFSMEGLRIRDEGERPVSIRKFEMAIRNYENFIRDSAYAIQFDSILFNDNRVSLSNFEYRELENGRRYNQLRMRQLELYGLSWDELVFNQKLKAEQITLIRPDIRYNIAGARRRKNHDMFETLASLSKAMQLERTHIIQGQVHLMLPNAAELRLDDATILLETKELLQATRARDLRDAIQYLDFKKGVYSQDGWETELKEAQFIGGENRALAGGLKVSYPGKITLSAEQVEAPVMVFDEYMQLRAVHGLHWKKADLRAEIGGTGAPKALPDLQLSSISGEQTSLLLQRDSLQIKGLLTNFELGEWQSLNQERFIDGVSFTMLQLNANSPELHLKADSWDEQAARGGLWKNLNLVWKGNTDSLSLEASQVNSQFNWNDILKSKMHLEKLQLVKPVFRAHLGSNGGSQTNNWSIGELLLKEPVISVQTADQTSFQWQSTQGDSLLINNAKMEWEPIRRVSAGQVAFRMQGLSWKEKNRPLFQTGSGLLAGKVESFQATRNDLENWDWKGNLSEFEGSKLSFNQLGSRRGELNISSGRVKDLKLQSGWLINLSSLLQNNPNLQLREWTGTYSDSVDQFKWHNFAYNLVPNLLTADSFLYKPAVDSATFHRRLKFQSDYVTASTGKITMGPVDLAAFARDSVLSIGTLHISNGFLDDYRDKRIPREPGIVRALPGNLLRKIPFRFRADTILVTHANVLYEEVDDKTHRSGTIAVTDLNGQILGARNFDQQPGDSLYIEARAKLADHIDTRLRVQEAYADSLGGFRMQVSMGQGDLAVLNPVLAALARAELRSGHLDSLQMWVQGQENIAYGTMVVYYDQLKVEVIRDRPRSLGARLTNLLANTIIRNRNKGKEGRVFVVRLRDRSAVNYLVKITLSGVMSNIGLRKPAKEARKYKKEIREMLQRQSAK
jgi:hypothetical protein